jgi:hypothetical protein
MAATMGSIAVRGSRSSPSTSSRLISSPTTRKNTTMSASLTTWWRVIWNVSSPTTTPMCVAHRASQASATAELASTSAAIAAARSSTPLAASWRRKSRRGNRNREGPGIATGYMPFPM